MNPTNTNFSIMEQDRKLVIDSNERHVFGRSIRQPIVLCSRNFDRPMYPLTVQLCYFCQKSTAERDCFVTDSGTFYFSMHMCSRCMEYNKSIQEAGSIVLRRHIAEKDMVMTELDKKV
jgi:hypothetical protein